MEYHARKYECAFESDSLFHLFVEEITIAFDFGIIDYYSALANSTVTKVIYSDIFGYIRTAANLGSVDNAISELFVSTVQKIDDH